MTTAGPAHAESSPRTYLVCGGRRTGTTLLAAILCSEPRANPLGPEAQVLTRFVEAYSWGRERFEDFGRFYFGDLHDFTAFYAETARRFLRQIGGRISPGGILILKNPELAKVLLDVAALIPDGRVLATVRDPRDQVASELEVGARQLAAGFHAPHIQARDVELLAASYASYLAGIVELERREPERITIIRYENLVRRPHETLGKLRAVTGLNLCFDPGRSWPRVSPMVDLRSAPSRSDLYDAPISSRSVGRFERDLSAAEVATVERVCGELMARHGYSRST